MADAYNNLERGEQTPLLVRASRGQPEHELLEGMESECIKEKAVTGFAGVGCTCVSSIVSRCS
jgi:hypothetical protein